MGNKRRNLGDTQPMQPVNPQRAERAERRTQRGQKNYREAYERELEYRRAVSRTPAPQNRSGQRSRSRQQESSLSAIIQQMRKKKKKEGTKYFDYDLLLVIIFLMCFGLIMLYSTSAYTAQVENGNDMFYFTKQAIIGAVGILIMLAVSKIDYHIYAAFHTEIFLVAMVLMALVKTPLGMELNGARRWIQLPGNMSFQPAEVTKIAVILFISYKLCEYGKKAYGIRGWLKIGAYGVVAAGGVFVLTDNLSTAPYISPVMGRKTSGIPNFRQPASGNLPDQKIHHPEYGHHLPPYSEMPSYRFHSSSSHQSVLHNYLQLFCTPFIIPPASQRVLSSSIICSF